MWYFAYGSNLSTAQMIARTGIEFTGSNKPIRARLPGYRLAFNLDDGSGSTFANIVRPGDEVLGVLYRCTRENLEALDGFEQGYDRVPVEVLDEEGNTVNAFAYIARPEFLTSVGRPTVEYLHRIVRGAREHGLPEVYIRSIEVYCELST